MPQARTSDELGEIAYACAWTIPVPFVVLQDNAIVFVNAAAVEVLGYDGPWRLLGSDVDAILHSDAREAAANRRTVVANGERLANIPSKMLTQTGEGVAVRVTAELIEVDGACLTLVQLRQARRCWPPRGWPEPPNLGPISRALGRAVLEALDVPVIVHTATELLFANALARQQLGAESIQEIAGRPMLSVLHPDSVLPALQRGVFFWATRQPILNVPVKLRGLNGSVMRATADAYPVKAGATSVALVVGVDDVDGPGS